MRLCALRLATPLVWLEPCAMQRLRSAGSAASNQPAPNLYPSPRSFRRGEQLGGRQRETAELLDLLFQTETYP